MNVHKYTTIGGKDLIKEYLNKLPPIESAEGYKILELLEVHGIAALDELDTRQLKGKVWEIRYSNLKQRMMYVVVDGDNIYILHACKKQKRKAELIDIKRAIYRAKELEKLLNKKLL